ncbi:MmgE/PrpD family protein [uncultured Paracoccus sp.]|uniref:MmgE/PrpD family protein n=1 Tax=uncultured Paracoccus sp. TaxID=189685 RepID=UPI0025973E56|nr:MmgE/PrpD family protein [uncultured Paracoccus sp.]
MYESPSIDHAEMLADWIAGFDLSKVPVSAVDAAKNCLIDAVACMVGGIALKSSQVVLEVVTAAGTTDLVTVPGGAARVGLLDAAWLGGHTVNALDFDDCFREGAPSHPGATIIPPALAVAEARGATGAELLGAIIAAYEVSLRIGRAVDASPERKEVVMGYSPWQTFGATVAASRLLGLGTTAIRSAFGIAAMQAPVPGVRKEVEGLRPYGWIKNAYGACCHVGVLSSLLAEKGFHGHQSIFDGPFGFWIMSGSDRHLTEGYAGLGEDWLITRVEFKPYACCRWSHTMIEALIRLGDGLAPEDIAAVDVHGFLEFYRGLGGDMPDNIVDAQFNARYLAAVQLLGRSPEFGMSEADLTDPAVAEMAGRVRLHHDPDYDAAHNATMATPVRVEISTTGGAVRSLFIDEPPTSVRRGGFNRDQICAKFRRVCDPVLGADRSGLALSMLLDVENADVPALMRLLAAA